ncbi:RNA polymerase II transcriptional coactivator KELP-like isoform X4 [Prosopis cineraria]|uniref:RNA polymerase II transcriptional coactivator KELP-like isoform X4 n=1 Tax=Prosopis cineraria TaxID=364024 RepID=UPI00240F3F0E|nr:RNA polymerase II transcriptional coactivator KELP-like isoform X4 [Prosopis cineraria]
MESETRRKIEETVLDVLKNSNVDEATEFTVRLAASERLGIDLCVSEHKLMVRGIVESYLLAIAEEEGGRVPASEPSAPQETREVMQDEQEAKPNKEVKEDSERIICQLSNKRNVVVHDFRGKRLVSIRDYYQKDGKQFPSAKGISLSTDQWSVFKKSVPAIEEAITKMEAKMGSEVYGKQNGDVPKPNLDAPPLDLVSAASPPEPVPIEISRFDGKNYHLWVQQMESLLKQLKIAYVLTELCPNATPGPHASAVEVAEARAAEKRLYCLCWNDD